MYRLASLKLRKVLYVKNNERLYTNANIRTDNLCCLRVDVRLYTVHYLWTIVIMVIIHHVMVVYGKNGEVQSKISVQKDLHESRLNAKRMRVK